MHLFESEDLLLKMPRAEIQTFKAFLQGMLNRKQQGFTRYGIANRRQKYLTRMKKELAAYEVSHNMEQLLNIAVYCYLESYAPESGKVNFDNTVDSVTRGLI